ncbi:MAG: choice-of-anchor J domain-containing protein [Bacteroidales bacterium]|nr:choice-of-anchor J domain-containing protein [Bacteroidales bacterium]MDD4385146.1 choice-of-anchor J domain-containing protein [Bacteroidales bacterium]
MRNKIFTLFLALTFLLGGIVNAQNSFYSKAAASKVATELTGIADNGQDFTKGTAEDYQVASKAFVPTKSGAKAVFLEETFETEIPTTWTVENTGTGAFPGWYWKSSDPSTNLLGIAIIDSDSNGSGQTTAGTITSPAVDVTGQIGLLLEFDTRYNDLTTGNAEIAKVDVWDGTAWINLLTWDEDHGTASVPEHITLDITAHANAALQVRFDYTDGGAWDWEWSIDNVKIFTLEAHDLGVTAIGPSITQLGQDIIPSVTIKNFGATEETSYSVALSIPDLSYSETITVTTPIAFNNSAVIDFPAITAPLEGIYEATATVTVTDDSFAENNTLIKDLTVLEFSFGYGFNAYGGDVPEGPVKINLATGDLISIATNDGEFWSGADWANGIWYACQSTTNNLLTIDPLTGAETVIGPLGVASATGMAFDIITQTMYLSDWTGSETNIYTVDLTTGATTLVGSAGANLIIGIACGGDGTLYGVDISTDKLWTINKTTGAATEVGALGVDISYAQDIAFDRDNNILYGTLYTTTGGLYTINIATGAATLVSEIVSEVVGFAIPYVAIGAYANFTVTDGTDPIQGAVINISNNNFTTDALGQVSIFLVEGDYSYTVSAFGYEGITSATDITIVDGVDVPVSVTMVALSALDVTFNIKNTLDEPLNAAITVYFEGNVYQTATAVAGTLTMSAVPIGSYTFDVAFEGYVAQTDLPLEVVGTEVIKDITLFEVMVNPYALMVDVNNAEKTALFSWNNVTGWAESFETSVPPAGWTNVATNAIETWEQVGTVTFSSGDVVPVDGSFQAEVYWDYGHQDEWLITNEFLVPNNGKLEFWSYSGAQASPNGDHYYVKISTDGGTTWTVLWDVVTSTTVESVYSEVIVDLSTYAGQDVKLAWQAVDGDGQGLWFAWFIDKVLVEMGTKAKAFESYTVYLDGAEVATDVTALNYTFEGLAVGTHTAGVKAVYATGATEIITTDFEILPVGVPTDATPSIAVYPNPSNGVYNIIVENATVVVTDITGRTVLTKEIRNNGEIDLSAQPNGIYIFKVGSRNLKVVKQ